MSLEEIIENRIEKLHKLTNRGLRGYAYETNRTYTIQQVLESFENLSKKSEVLFLAGRIVGWRGHGGAAFVDLKDATGNIQILFREDKIGKKARELLREAYDIGDFVEVKGCLITTKRGEKTLEATDFNMLSKSLRPLPEKWYGLKDMEERHRKRYLDLIFNSQVKKRFEIRSKIIKQIREFLEERGFLEVETPILQPIYGGARARPFKTYINSLDMEAYLRISPELYLKRLLVGGFEKIYEIGKCFRNEGIDKSHNPDFTMLEFYWAYTTYRDLMELTEQMFIDLALKIWGKKEITSGGKKIKFDTPWQRMEFLELFQKHTDIDYQEVSRDKLAEKAKELEVTFDAQAPKVEIADEIYKKYCRKKIVQPTFVLHHPKGFQPLAKEFKKNPDKLANFQLVINGMELVNAFSELNNPVEQRKRFEGQEKLFDEGWGEAQRIDEDFLESLEYGMPPASGFGMGVGRLVLLLTDADNLREVILFPTRKPRQ